MKSNTYRAVLPVLALSLTFLGVGCKEKTGSTTDASMSAGTNAAPADADNTARNVRDRNDATMTALDQGSTPADVEISKKIRKALTADPNYSVTAKNVKIITANGKVTLRGPVKNDAEKTGIVKLAKDAAGEANVEDNLEVKANL